LEEAIMLIPSHYVPAFIQAQRMKNDIPERRDIPKYRRNL
jgi:hypothetical protein